MTTETAAPSRSAAAAGRESFWHLVHAEWTKFRTVRGWVIAALAAIAATVAVGLLGSGNSCAASTAGSGGGPQASAAACPAPSTGPGGDAVTDAFYFAHQPLTGNGTITVQMTSLTGRVLTGFSTSPHGDVPSQTAPGLQPWSKAGIIIKENLSQGSAYAAMMATGSNGVRMQWDYVSDTPGLAGSVSASSPRWLRLVRDGDTITGYDSADGTRWTLVGTATLPGLTSTVQAGLFAASPENEEEVASGLGSGSYSGNPTVAAGTFRHIGLSWPATGWTETNVGGFGPNGAQVAGTFSQSAAGATIGGSGDIAPKTEGSGNSSIEIALIGSFAALIALIALGAVFITTEYRRGLIYLSLTASPRRGRLLAAKTVVIGAVSFVTGLIAAAATVAVGEYTLRAGGTPVLPVPAPTVVRMVIGTAAMLAVAAVIALAIGLILRRSAAAVATVIALIFIPYLLSLVPNLLPFSVEQWLLRITPAAGFSVQQALPEYRQVIPGNGGYLAAFGYYPLAPWAGFAVECAWAAAALALAAYLLRRRDA